MADSKISALPASTTPLAGTEVLPIVQSSTTKQVSVANLTAGRAISATQLTLTTGNLIVASGQGIDFSATAGTGTSELLADYEEGTWTYDFTATTGTITKSATYPLGLYTKIGRQVTITGFLQVTSVSSPTGTLTLTGLPFPISSASDRANFVGSGIFGSALSAGSVSPLMVSGSAGNSSLTISKFVTGSAASLAGDVVADTRFQISFSYFT